MQILLALLALPAVALLLALASRLEDGLPAEANAPPRHAVDPSALTTREPSSPPAGTEPLDLSAAEPQPSPASRSG